MKHSEDGPGGDRTRFETIAVHGGERRPGPEGSVVFPIYQGTVYSHPAGTDYHDLKYIRLNSTPSQRYLHDKLAALEGAEAALATSSGMAAFSSSLIALLKKGDHLLAGSCLYGGTYDFITQHADGLGVTCTFVDAQNPGSWEAAVRPNTRLFLTETITNPLMRVPPLKDVVSFARRHDLVTLVDNTFASPVNCRPLSIGIDLVFHSATKYLNGHSDLVAGCLMGRGEVVEKVRRTLNLFGGSLDPHAGFLLARGIKTLALRVRAASANALGLARFLSQHPKVAAVNYPGLETHPDYKQAREELSGFGGMLSLRLKDGVPAVERFMAAVRIPTIAPSLGGVETLMTRPAITSHAGMTREQRESAGVTDDLVRMSCGIEHTEDLVEDLRQALAGC
ncbi:MAG TPA: aminotransferase class I/II-fold pyridoxal phosphate-dependent enzyme [Patescibacteria group bacterium]|nr:aminotransferase class I/II-fold pyridoxal phosphate-dependent enzyme [Patescibacteria group bacterium]